MLIRLIPSIPVRDVQSSADFYEKVLGFDLVGFRGRGDQVIAHLRSGKVEIIFRSMMGQSNAQEMQQEDRQTWFIIVDNVFQMYRRIMTSRYEVHCLNHPEPTLFGTAEFAIEDIDGRKIVFSQVFPEEHTNAAVKS